jgi:hypothetical protein
MKQLTKAVISVMKEVRGMEKNSRVGQGGHAYNGTKDQDVKEVFNEALAKNGLIMFPKDIDEHTQVDRWEEKTNYGIKQKQSVFTKVKVHYTLMHESGEEVTVCGYGHGVDPQDKAAGKATTYAMKNALLYTFLTPVGKIDDTETTHSNEIPTPQAKKQTAPPKKQTAPPNKAELKPNTEQWEKAIKYLVDGGVISQIEAKYALSEVNRQLLMDEVLK